MSPFLVLLVLTLTVIVLPLVVREIARRLISGPNHERQVYEFQWDRGGEDPTYSRVTLTERGDLVIEEPDKRPAA